MRVLGVDPGLTRCGVGVVDGTLGRPVTLVAVDVIRTPASMPLGERLVHIEKGIDSSNGCTNLRPEDAAFLYRTLRVGDVVQYVHVKGPAATMSTAFADWDVPWPTWVKGGAVPTS